MVLGLLGLLTITAIPTVTGVAEGISHQKEQNAEAANDTRMAKFHLDVFCGARSSKRDEVHDRMVVLRKNKLHLHPKDPKTLLPLPSQDGSPPPHPFTGFYFMYPDEDRESTRGLVSTISVDPPMLNWIYADKRTLELKYGNRTQSIEHIVGPWDWTEDEVGLTIEDWEGFVAVEEEEGEWAVYLDWYDDRLKSLRGPAAEKIKGKRILPCSLERRILPDELQGKDKEEPKSKEVNSKTQGGIKVSDVSDQRMQTRNNTQRQDY